MSGDNDDLNMIEPEARPPVQFMGRAVEVRPLTVGQIPAVARLLRGIEIGAVFDDKGALGDLDFIGLIADHGENIVGAVALAVGLKSDEVEKSQPDEFLELARAVFEVNSDFFIRKIAPQILASIKAAGGLMARAAGGVGATASKPSSAQGTASQK